MKPAVLSTDLLRRDRSAARRDRSAVGCHPLWRLPVLCLLSLVAGCASWNQSPSLSSALLDQIEPDDRSGESPANRLHRSNKKVVKAGAGQVVLDVDFVHVPIEKLTRQKVALLWQWVDETSVDLSERRRLLSNGLRTGRISDPVGFREQLDELVIEPDIVDQFLASAAVGSEGSEGTDRIPMRLGQSYELPLAKPLPSEQVTLVRMADQTIGRTLTNPQYLFSITPLEWTHQRLVQIRLRPEVQFGQIQQKLIGSDSALRIDRRRQVWSLPMLDLNLSLQKNDQLVITADTLGFDEPEANRDPAADSSLASKMMSSKNADHQTEQLFLLIRVAEVPSA